LKTRQNVFEASWLAGLALVANILGTAALFYSFQATSSAFRFIKRDLGNSQYEYRICADEKTLSQVDTMGNTRMSFGPCPLALDPRSAAIVTIEHQSFVSLGFGLLGLGFVIQFFTTGAVSRATRRVLRRMGESEIDKHK
jgi:hypothetical protein